MAGLREGGKEGGKEGEGGEKEGEGREGGEGGRGKEGEGREGGEGRGGSGGREGEEGVEQGRGRRREEEVINHSIITYTTMSFTHLYLETLRGSVHLNVSVLRERVLSAALSTMETKDCMESKTSVRRES